MYFFIISALLEQIGSKRIAVSIVNFSGFGAYCFKKTVHFWIKIANP
jgi:hypothetical protein